MNEETMRKHYERTPKETLINILISSREQVDKLQKRNKECKQEIERLKQENEELKHKLKLINSYVYGCNIDSLGSDKE